MSRIRSRLTYANVMATLAVFIALGGSSYAVSDRPAQPQAQAAQSSGSATVRPNSVKTGSIANGAVTTADIGTGQVISSDIRDGSIQVVDLSPAVVERLKKEPKPESTTDDDDDDDDDDTTTTPTSTVPGLPAPVTP
jgi:hypothetical protein